MDHVGHMLLAVVSDVLEAKPPWEVEVELHCGALPHPANGVLDVNVDLRAVESSAALIDAIVQSSLFQRRAKGVNRQVPFLVQADSLVWLRGEHDLKFREIKHPEQVKGHVQHAIDLIDDLVRAAEYVGIVLGHPPDTEHSVECSSALISIDRTKLSDPHGQITVASQTVPIVHDMEWAIHGFQIIILSVHVHRSEHIIFEVFKVATGLPQRRASDVGRVDQIVTPAVVFASPKVFEQPSDPGAFGMPYNEARPRLFMD